jgi:hypothetical protein
MKPLLLALAVAIALPALPVQSQELPILPGAMTDLDGISAECIVQTPDRFAETACASLFKAAGTLAKNAGITLVEAGTTNWEGVPVPDRKHLDPPAGGLAKPVRLTFFIRGAQSDRITGGYMRAVMWLPAETGKLVLWEAATLGTGPRKGLRTAVIKSVTEKLEAPFAAFASDNAAQ